MIIPFREHHLFQFLNGFKPEQIPLDLAISHYFRDNKALGSKDRAFIAENIYGMIRWQRLIDHLSNGNNTWQARFECFRSMDIAALQKDTSIPQHVRLGFPEELYSILVESHGEEKAAAFCLASNTPAPTCIRVNTLKISRDNLFAKWKDTYQVEICKHSANGIIFLKKIHFFSLPEFQEGMFEIQDEGSQLVAALIQPKAGQHVMDYCSGSGGKTLAFAPTMGCSGQIYLHDIRSNILVEAKKRLRRAGIQNSQLLEPETPMLKKLKKKMDWVLVDAPCSGTGTLRRNPDMKEKIDRETIQRLQGEQRLIFERALSFLKPNGRIVYATCSVLKEENEMQLEHFIKTYQLQVEGVPFQSLPVEGEMDGFYAVVLKRELPQIG